MYHIMVYSRGFDSEYEHPCVVHLFINKKLSPEEAFKIAEEILNKHFPEWKKYDRSLAYVGYEYIPLDLTQAEMGYVAASFRYVGLSKVDINDVVSTVPQQLAYLEEYRKRFITLDYDNDYVTTRASIIDALDYLAEIGCKNIKVFKTYRGYHVRAELTSPLPFDKIFEIRRKFDDDYSRIAIDRAYVEKSMGFLANLLFNSKCWIEFPTNTLQCYEEKEISPESITTERIVNISLKLPRMKITLRKGVIEIDGKQVKFIGNFTERDVKAIVLSIEDNLWEYAYTGNEEDIKEKIKKAYWKISPSLAVMINNCDVRLKNGVVLIRVPKHLQQVYAIGRLIGKQGQNIKAVESELGIKIRIIQDLQELPEEVAMKRRLQDLLKNLM